MKRPLPALVALALSACPAPRLDLELRLPAGFNADDVDVTVAGYVPSAAIDCAALREGRVNIASLASALVFEAPAGEALGRLDLAGDKLLLATATRRRDGAVAAVGCLEVGSLRDDARLEVVLEPVLRPAGEAPLPFLVVERDDDGGAAVPQTVSARTGLDVDVRLTLVDVEGRPTAGPAIVVVQDEAGPRAPTALAVPVDGLGTLDLEIDAGGPFALTVRGPWSDDVLALQGLAIVGGVRRAHELIPGEDETVQLLPWAAGDEGGVVEVVVTTTDRRVGGDLLTTTLRRKRLTEAGLVDEGAPVVIDDTGLRALGVAHGLAFLHEGGTSELHTLALDDGFHATERVTVNGTPLTLQLGSVIDASVCGGEARAFLADLSVVPGAGAILGLTVTVDRREIGTVTTIPQAGPLVALAGVAAHGNACLQGENLGVLTVGLSSTSSTQRAQNPLATTSIAVFDDVTAVPDIGDIVQGVAGVLPARGLPIVPGVDAEGVAHDAMGIVAVTRGFDVALLSLRIEEGAVVLGDVEAVLPAPPLALVAVRRGDGPPGLAALVDVDGTGALLHVLGPRTGLAPRLAGGVAVPCDDPERCDLVAFDLDGDGHDELVVLAGNGAGQQLVTVRLVPAP